MEISHNALAQRLRQARMDRGITQEQAALEIGVPRTAIIQIEAGKRTISTLELARLAALYGKPILGFFNGEPAETPLAASTPEGVFAQLRATASINSPAIQEHIQQQLAICRTGAKLQKQLDREIRPCFPLYGLGSLTTRSEAVSQGEEIAAKERSRLELGDAPLSSLAELIGGQGLWVAEAALDESVSGMFIQDPQSGMTILVNKEHAPQRKRFSLAHEYAHALMDRQDTTRVSEAGNATDLPETRANAFAAGFLMPEAGIRSFLSLRGKGAQIRERHAVYDVSGDTGFDTEHRHASGSQTIAFQDVADVAHYFGVSYRAMVYRLHTLALVNMPCREGLLQTEPLGNRYLTTLKSRGVGSESEIGPSLKGQVAYLALEAFRRQVISQGRLGEIAKLLDIQKAELLELAFGLLGQQTEKVHNATC